MGLIYLLRVSLRLGHQPVTKTVLKVPFALVTPSRCTNKMIRQALVIGTQGLEKVIIAKPATMMHRIYNYSIIQRTSRATVTHCRTTSLLKTCAHKSILPITSGVTRPSLGLTFTHQIQILQKVPTYNKMCLALTRWLRGRIFV